MEHYLVEIVQTEGEGDRLVFSGELTLQHTAEMKSSLMRMISVFSSSLNIVVKDITEFDLSFLQLLESFLNALKINHIDFIVNWEADEEQMKLLCGSGFSKYI